ncbi:hypothetical protein VTN96DRAFT_4920 [Rasamsonia emersonii]
MSCTAFCTRNAEEPPPVLTVCRVAPFWQLGSALRQSVCKSPSEQPLLLKTTVLVIFESPRLNICSFLRSRIWFVWYMLSYVSNAGTALRTDLAILKENTIQKQSIQGQSGGIKKMTAGQCELKYNKAGHSFLPLQIPFNFIQSSHLHRPNPDGNPTPFL